MPSPLRSLALHRTTNTARSLTTLHCKKLGLASVATHLTGTTSFAKGAFLDTMSAHYV